MAEVNDIELGFIPVEAPPIPEGIDGLSSPVTGCGGLQYYYPYAYTELGDPFILNNIIIDKLCVTDIFLKRFLYDKDELIGIPGQVLLSDAQGVRWGNVSSSLPPLQTIDILDEGSYAATVSRIDFRDGSDPNNLVSAVGVGTTDTAIVYISDRWSLSGSNIYRNSRVGINNPSPVYDLDVSGTTNITLTLNVNGATTLNSTLDVDGGTTLNSTLDVDGATTLNNILDVDGATTLNSTLDVDGGTTLNNILDVDGATTLNNTLDVDGGTTLNSTLDVDGATTLNNTLDVDGGTTLNNTLDVDGDVTFNSLTSSISKDTGALVITNGGVGVEENLNVGGYTRIYSVTQSTSKDTGALIVEGGVGIEKNVSIGQSAIVFGTTSSTSKDTGALIVEGGVGIEENLNIGGYLKINSDIQSTDKDTGALIVEGGVGIEKNVNIGGYLKINSDIQSTDKDTGALVVEGGVGIEKNLNVGQNTKLTGTLELDSSLIDINGSTATGKKDYRLASVGTGVSWRPPGVQTQNAIWVTMDGNDLNSGYLEGDAKQTIGAAAAIAEPGDTIFIRSGVYTENNPIGLRNDVSISGQDLRLVTIVPLNTTKDVFHVRRGCLIENLNFAGQTNETNHPGCGAVAFPPTNPSDYAVSGYIAAGPADEGPSGRWRSPYVRNCTNFMRGSIGMKINGDHATGSTIGADLKSMVCDSFTQYNEAGIGVSIANNGYAQLVSIFTINCDIAIYCETGGSCDLTNSNSSFGNFGLVAVGLGRTEFTGEVLSDTPGESDIVQLSSVFDTSSNPRRPYDGQALWFKINLDNYPDAQGSGVIAQPLQQLDSITVTNGGSGYSSSAPPSIIIIDLNDGTQSPKGPQGIIAEASPTIDDATGSIVGIDVINSGRNYLSTQNIQVVIVGDGGASATANMSPIYYTISAATEQTLTGITTVTFNEFIPYELFAGDEIELRRISRILTSSHSFEYIGTGTSINTSTPFQGAVPIKANEVVARDGAQIPFTSTNQKGNFEIGEGLVIDQTTNTIRGRDFSRAIQAEVTPLILALR